MGALQLEAIRIPRLAPGDAAFRPLKRAVPPFRVKDARTDGATNGSWKGNCGSFDSVACGDLAQDDNA